MEEMTQKDRDDLLFRILIGKAADALTKTYDAFEALGEFNDTAKSFGAPVRDDAYDIEFGVLMANRWVQNVIKGLKEAKNETAALWEADEIARTGDD